MSAVRTWRIQKSSSTGYCNKADVLQLENGKKEPAEARSLQLFSDAWEALETTTSTTEKPPYCGTLPARLAS
jgi:hypothetical protein